MEQLAKGADCHYSMIARLEAEDHDPSWMLALRIAEVLGVSLDDFRSTGKEPEPPKRGPGRPPKSRSDEPPPAAKKRRRRQEVK